MLMSCVKCQDEKFTHSASRLHIFQEIRNTLFELVRHLFCKLFVVFAMDGITENDRQLKLAVIKQYILLSQGWVCISITII